MFVNASNNAETNLSNSVGSSDTSITVEDPSVFPDVPFLITVNNRKDNMEIMKVTDVDGSTLTVERGKEGTSASSHDSNSIVENNFTAGTYQALVAEIQALKQQAGIAEMGENENGSYIRYENGVQICWNKSDNITSADRSSGALFWGDESFTFPKKFSETPSVSPISHRDSGVQWSGLAEADEDGCRIYIFQAVEDDDYGGYLGYQAIGRWK